MENLRFGSLEGRLPFVLQRPPNRRIERAGSWVLAEYGANRAVEFLGSSAMDGEGLEFAGTQKGSVWSGWEGSGTWGGAG